MGFEIKRVYEKPSPRDGKRILVDRIWPRGISKSAAHLDAWLKDIAPSTELRKWFGHEPSRWPEFRKKYKAELTKHKNELTELREVGRTGNVTLLYAAKDDARNNAVVLKEVLSSKK